MRSSLSFSLSVEGYSVQVFSEAQQLLDSPSIFECDCLVVDHRLPGMTGLELLAELRRRGVGAPAILITTHPDANLRRQAQMAGATIVEKPLTENALMDGLHAVIAERPDYPGGTN